VAQVVRVGVIGTGFGADVVVPAFSVTSGCEVVDIVTPRDDAAVAALCARTDVDLSRSTRDPSCTSTTFAKRYHFQYSRFIARPQPRPYGWLSTKELGGGWLAGQGSHLIDACRWLFGEIAQAGAVMRTLVAERTDRNGERQNCDAEDAFVATLRTATGVTAVIDCGLESSVSTPERMAVFGATGVLEIGEAGIVRRMAEGNVESYGVKYAGTNPARRAMGGAGSTSGPRPGCFGYGTLGYGVSRPASRGIRSMSSSE
jgi:predicted dehydrogenase